MSYVMLRIIVEPFVNLYAVELPQLRGQRRVDGVRNLISAQAETVRRYNARLRDITYSAPVKVDVEYTVGNQRKLRRECGSRRTRAGPHVPSHR